MRKTCLEMVHELAKQDSRVVFVGSDLGVDTLNSMKEEFPDRFFMEGISEQNVVGMAAGMAMEGKIVYVNTIATFLTRRCYEQVALDVCLHDAKVRLIGNGGGLVYAPLGPTHLAVEDLAIMRALPNMSIVCPADAVEMRQFMKQSLDVSGAIYIRLGKGHDPIITDRLPEFQFGKATIAAPVASSGKGWVLTTGITLHLALEAREKLLEQGVEIGILHYSTLKPFDVETLQEKLEVAPWVLSIEEHSRIGGLGSAVAEFLVEASSKQIRGKRFHSMGLPNVFPDQYGSQKSLMARYGLAVENLIDTVKKLEMESSREM